MKAWIYARASSNKRTQDASPTRQLEILRSYVERREWTLAGEGHDRMSGGKFDRPELLRARAAIVEGRANVICVQTLSRLGRSVVEVVGFSNWLREQGAHLVVLKMAGETVDTTTALGRFFFNVMASVDQLQRELYGELAMEAQEMARAKGVPIGRPREVVPPEVLARAAALRSLSTVPGWDAVGLALAKEGHVQPARALRDGTWRKARPWSGSTLRRAAAKASPGETGPYLPEGAGILRP